MTHKPFSAIFIFLTFILATGCAKKDLTEHKTFDKEITSLHLSVDSADVSVLVSDNGKSEVDVDMEYRGNRPNTNISVTDNALKVKINCPFSCDGDIIVRVPAEAAASLKLDSGNLDIHDLEGDTIASVDSGNMKLYNLSGDLELDADSGTISGTVSSTICYADVDSGNISITFEETPEDIDVGADSGDVKLRVPEDAYRVSTKVDSGNKKISNITVDNDSPNRIHVDVDSGDIRIIGI